MAANKMHNKVSDKNKGILYDSKIVDVCVKLFNDKKFKFKKKR